MLNFSLGSQVIVVCVMDGVGVCTTYAYAHLPKNKLSDAADYARKWENQWSWNKNKRKQQTLLLWKMRQIIFLKNTKFERD